MLECKEVNYKGYKAVALTTSKVELVVSIEFGPRILSFRTLPNGINFLKNFQYLPLLLQLFQLFVQNRF